ncbi:hypothetical protein WK11_19290 [Burkholderia ubonensis]|nr:hypothetical protein WK11_19290 [Burkholderia ubonensis]KVU14913.1 hypothetical protein WK62_30165 [Burkholderia ubonensis]
MPLIALQGCSIINSLENISLQMNQRRCEQFGFVRGTDAFAECMLRQQALDEDRYERQQLIEAIQRR